MQIPLSPFGRCRYYPAGPCFPPGEFSARHGMGRSQDATRSLFSLREVHREFAGFIESMMLRSIGVTARTLVIFAFLLLMPLLAFPPIRQWMEQRADTLWPSLLALVTKIDAAATPSHDDQFSIPEPNVPPPSAPETGQLAFSLHREIEQLRDLGARDMRWETHGETERFVCHVPLDVGGVYARQFAATASDRLASARHVRDEIQTWRQMLRDRQGSVEIEVGLHIPAAQLPRGRQSGASQPRHAVSPWQGLP